MSESLETQRQFRPSPTGFILVVLALIAVGHFGGARATPQSAHRAPGDIIWTDSYDHAMGGDASGSIVWHRSRVIAGGGVDDGTNFFVDPYVRAYRDATGAVEWEANVDLGQTGEFERVSALAAARGRVFTAGQANKASGDSDFVVGAYNARRGAQSWQDQFDLAAFDDRAVAIAARRSEVVAAGSVDRGTGLGTDFAVRAYDARNGTTLWQTVLDEAGENDQVTAVTIHRNRAVVTGDLEDSSRDSFWLVRAYDVKSGVMSWEDRFDPPSLRARTKDVVGHRRWVYVCGTAPPTNGPEELSQDFAVRAYDVVTGELAWEDFYNFEGNEDRCDAIAAHRGRVFAVGRLEPATLMRANDTSDAIVRAYTASTGELLWDLALNGGTNGTFRDVAVDNDGVYVVGNFTNDDDDLDMVVYAFDPASGDQLWSEQFDRDSGSDTGGAITSHKGAVYIAAHSTAATSTDWEIRAYSSQ